MIDRLNLFILDYLWKWKWSICIVFIFVVNFFIFFFDVFKKKNLVFVLYRIKIVIFVRELVKTMFYKNICRTDIGGLRYVGREYGDVDARYKESYFVRREGGEKWFV